MGRGTRLEREPKLADSREVSSYDPPPGVVVEPGEVTVVLSYPLAAPFAFAVEVPPPGFTTMELVARIMELYGEIYEEEAATATVAEGRMAPHLLNRNVTDGSYGIWGHDLEDLVVEGLSIGLGPDGARTVVPSIGS